MIWGKRKREQDEKRESLNQEYLAGLDESERKVAELNAQAIQEKEKAKKMMQPAPWAHLAILMPILYALQGTTLNAYSIVIAFSFMAFPFFILLGFDMAKKNLAWDFFWLKYTIITLMIIVFDTWVS